MREFKESKKCECGHVFQWNYIKLDNGESYFSRLDNGMCNVLNCCETSSQYIVDIRCPVCGERYHIEISKRKV